MTRRWWLSIPALVVLPLPAGAQGLCAALNRIIVSSRERPPFASLGRVLAGGEILVPGFGGRDCRVTPGTGVDCGAVEMNRTRVLDWPELAACLGGAAVPLEPGPGPRDWSRSHVVSGLRFRYGVRCTSCAGPSYSQLTITFDRHGRPDE